MTPRTYGIARIPISKWDQGGGDALLVCDGRRVAPKDDVFALHCSAPHDAERAALLCRRLAAGERRVAHHHTERARAIDVHAATLGPTTIGELNVL